MRNNSTLLHRLQLWFSDQPDSPAQFYKSPEQKWQSISVRAYWLQVVRIALYLQRLNPDGNHSDKRIVIFAPNSPEWVHWELGSWLAGMLSAGIHPNTLKADYLKMIEIVKPMLIVSDTLVHSNFSETEIEILTFKDASRKLMELVPEDEKSLALAGTQLLQNVTMNQPCCSIFTSGTTGTPKGVLLGLRQLTFVADSLSREWNLPFSNGVLFSFLPLAHVAEKIHSVAVALTMRYPVWFNSGFDRFLPELQEVRPTMLLAVPRVWQRMKEQIENHKPKLVNYLTEVKWVGTLLDQVYLNQVRSSIGLDRLRLAVSGAAKLPPMVFDWFVRLGVEIQEIYGMSETAGLITLTHPTRDPALSHAVGAIPTGTEVKLSPDGEVWVKGPHVFSGYDQNEEETKLVIQEDGWMKTGDLGEWINDSSGIPQLHLIGRIREIIKLPNGRMIAPVPIENELKKLPEVSNVCILGDQLPGLVALITLKESYLLHYKFTPGMVEGVLVEDEVLNQQIRTEVAKLYAEQKISEKILKVFILSRDFEIEYGEVTPTLKLNRNQIRKNFEHFIEFKLND
jgi:long-chain acyl-CoA synthetase